MASMSNFPVVAKTVHQVSTSSDPSYKSVNKGFVSTIVSPKISKSSVRLDESTRISVHCNHRNFGALRSGMNTPYVSVVSATAKTEPLKIMIAGAPASGKGTQCELITQKHSLVHISAGDLLRSEILAGSESGKQAKEYMNKGQLVPNEIVVTMVRHRLSQSDAQEKGWLLDGYPRSLTQAEALENIGIRPDLFILLDVPEEILVERVVGRRLDPVTGKIYHLKYSPPEDNEIAARLTQRFDDTEEKVKLRLQTHNQNVEDVLSVYKDIVLKVYGNAPKEDVFAEIDVAISELVEQKRQAKTSPLISGTIH